MENTDLLKRIEKLEGEFAEFKGLLKGSGKKAVVKSEEPGIVGTFNGVEMVTDEGEAFDVPNNYAAKTKLVYGDTLKMVQKGDQKSFKHIKKVNRKKVEGIVSKKEGNWYVLTEHGSHRIVDEVVDYNKIKLNDKVFVLLPEKKPFAPYATFDRLITQKEDKEVGTDERVNTIGGVKSIDTNTEGEMTLVRSDEAKVVPPQNDAKPKEDVKKAGVSPNGQDATKQQGNPSEKQGLSAKPKKNKRKNKSPNVREQKDEKSSGETEENTPKKEVVFEDDDLR
ncbi:hypothetical protein JXA34_03130 [Patescibacteria group bacterium]|nr:hypothetical protein [Patescibacteria group bacterium]